MMKWKVLKTEQDYTAASSRLMEIFHATPGTPESDEMELLLLLVEDYDNKHYTIASPDPLEVIKIKMEEKGIKAKDLEPILGSKGHVSSILSGRREITLKTARRLREFFQLPAEVFIPIS